ncbi:MAG: methionine--tRNA ligase [Candidatus Binatia bacterium]|nr:methionine--tRNA ligase [Candidatus Binatia bacterium]
MSDRAYITTPLYYVNAEPHLGSTYTNVVADTLARFQRQRGVPTVLQTGTDEHGEKIAETAREAGVSPKDFVDDVAAKFQATWDSCGIEYDNFIRTSNPAHIEFVQGVLARLHENDDIYFGSYEGLYCIGCERLYTEKELKDGLCPDHLTKPSEVSEPNYFFRMAKYQDAVREHIEKNPRFIHPEGYRNETLAILRDDLGDLCISRPKERLSWGIELPFDSNYVTYVWFDALLNYVSGPATLGRLDELWPATLHLIGKDILKPHAVFWPTMLLAAGFPLYDRLGVGGFWSSGGHKMSKSLGNVAKPLELRDKYGMDALRYFLLRDMAFGQDADFTEQALITRLNADLANGLGNLVSRTLAMSNKYFDGQIQPRLPEEPADAALAAAFATARTQLDQHIDNLAFHRGLGAVWEAIDAANKYVADQAPFKLVKDEAQRPRVGAILHNCVEALRVAAQLCAPVLPESAEKIREALGLSSDRFADLDLAWGDAFQDGHALGGPINLFPRVEA